ncbi:DNA repair protein [Aulographum hederae CBS 113979]|uniref:DNA repair protein REV1 n=1 Tax=Aulographum hederae CBS 113979 TaxID=1176131 RepID=A0A6G1GS33_9PEZI|nr:DNA repair protein [Aulographum hederae CBS 113979]
MGSRLESNSNAVRKRIEGHTFDDEEGEEYKGSTFGGFSDYFRRKKIKLQNLDAELRSQSADKPPIFRGVVAHVNGYTQPSLNDIHTLIVSHAGGFLQYLDGKTTVTHIIASSLTPKKAVEFRRYRIVKPAWVVESVKVGKLLPWDSFRVLDEGPGQQVLGFNDGQVVSQANKKTRGYRDQTETSWYTNQLNRGQLSQSVTGTPRGSQFLKQQPPTPEVEDDIVDLPPSHQQARIQPHKSPIVSPTLPVSPHSTPIRKRSAVLFKPLHPEEQGSDDFPAEAAPPDDLKPRNSNLEARDLRPDDLGLNFDGEAVTESPSKTAGKRPAHDPEESVAKRTKMTAEEHNAVLLADPRVRKSTVVNPEFLEQYYRESRLHHLSTWKADLKSKLQALTAEKTSTQKEREKRLPGTRRYILHVDFDSFFAAVSLKKHPELINHPCVVAHGNGSGSEIASCNYPARTFGVKNGMWMKRAQDLCPDLKILPYDFPAYEESSRAFYEAILSIEGVVQSVSIDEALVDVSRQCIAAGGTDGKRQNEGGVYREQQRADEIAQDLRDEVQRKTGCNVSVGIGGNILLAKVALRKAKPAGQYQIKPDEILDFIGQLQVQDLPGVAYSIGGKLEEIGIRLVRDVREFTRDKLITTLGPKTGGKIWEYSRGIDRAEVGDVVVRKSVSAEVNWGVRFENQVQVDEFIENLCGELSRRLLKEGVKGRQITMKIMKRAQDAPLDPPKHLGHGKCDTFNKSVALGVATNATDALTREALSILKSFGFTPGELRGIGVQMTKLEPLKPNQTDGSQRRLQFKVPDSKPSNPPAPLVSKGEDDPIQDDVVTPRKPKAHPNHIGFGLSQLYSNSPSRKPLNTLGTQFLLPSQVDPKVLAELPEDIRAKLAKHTETPVSKQNARARPASPSLQPQSTSSILNLPNQSQLDPSILAALPADVRAEIEAIYSVTASPPRRRTTNVPEQSLLPQSPRKSRTLPTTKSRGLGPRKRGRPSKADTLARASNATLTQSNFVFAPRGQAGGNREKGISPAADSEPSDAERGDTSAIREPDPEFLAALPEDIRVELLAEHRRARLAARSNLTFSKSKAKANQNQIKDSKPANEQRSRPGASLNFPPRPARPTFTSRHLTTLPDLRSAVSEWTCSFAEGPYGEDVEALGVYLTRVVSDERDLKKAVSVVEWMGWCVGEMDMDGKEDKGVMAEEEDGPEEPTMTWDEAVGRMEESVRGAVAQRGMGSVEFSY